MIWKLNVRGRILPIAAATVLAGSAAAAAVGGFAATGGAPVASHMPRAAAAPAAVPAFHGAAAVRPAAHAAPARLHVSHAVAHHAPSLAAGTHAAAAGGGVAATRSSGQASSGRSSEHSGTHHSGGGSGEGSGDESEAEGTVASVNGTTSPGTCGAAGASGSFTLAGEDGDSSDDSGTQTVNVTGATTFADEADPSPSFADVCVGVRVHASGVPGTSGLDASTVTVQPPEGQAEGTVTSVGGSSASGTCGTAGGSGSFVVSGDEQSSDGGDGSGSGDQGGSITVNVTSSTMFSDSADPSPSFADVCVGSAVDASGTVSADGLDAASVEVKAPEQEQTEASGTVTSVNGSSAQGMCGTAGASGSFVISSGDSGGSGDGVSLADDGGNGSPVTVNVTPSTVFESDGSDGSSASFADVCVGSQVDVTGTMASGTLTASKVSVSGDSQDGGDGGGGGGGDGVRSAGFRQ